MDSLKLLGMQRAEFQLAEKLNSRSEKAQLAIVLISMIAIFVKNDYTGYALAVITLFAGIIWQYFSYQSRRSHSVAERARRAVVFCNGLGIQVCGKSYSDLLMSFKVTEDEGKKYEDSDYFKATMPYGPEKLAKIIEESSFWSKHLFRSSANRSWIHFFLTLIVSIFGLLLIPLLNVGQSGLLIAQVFCLLLAWLVTGTLFTKALSFTEAANSTDDVEGRLSRLKAAGTLDNDILVTISDYNAIVEVAPTIPSSIYYKNKDRLNSLWLEREKDSS